MIEIGTLNTNKDGIDNLAFGQDWNLDMLGNWNRFRQDDDGDETWDMDQSRKHSQANEITDIGVTTGSAWIDPAHDAAGNMVTLPKPEAPDEGFTAVYDAWNRLVALTDDADNDATVAEYRYDGMFPTDCSLGVARPSDQGGNGLMKG